MNCTNLKKIKTIYVVHNSSNDTRDFDNQVNECLDNGWILGEIRIIEAQAPNVHDVYYARLEKWEDSLHKAFEEYRKKEVST